MAEQNHKSIKHAIIDKVNTTIIISVSIAAFVVVFSLFAIKSLVSQSLYQQRVISAKEETLKLVKSNKTIALELQTSFTDFDSEITNVLGGSSSGDGPMDGDNGKIVLDSLPSEYDLPALSSSIEKILTDGGYQIQSIGGTEEGNKDSNSDSTSKTSSVLSTPIEIPYPFGIQASTEQTINLLKTLESSIRPFYVTKLTIDSGKDALDTTIGLKTFYQPASNLQVSTKVVK